MGFKADSSFLHFLTMGALGVQKTISQLEGLGFQPIELERYCASNKIWTTKVKRLRLPDLLCVRTGTRMEVRAKNDLKIRMSDAPNNPDRAWDAGLRENDLIAFITCHNNEEEVRPAESAIFFRVGDLQNSVETSKLGPPKSASEGAERDRTWPCTVPKQNGLVLEVQDNKIRAELSSGRKQTYTLNGKTPYVSQGDTFIGLETMIAGTVSSPVDITERLADSWNPIELVQSVNDIDRYAACKALPHSENIPTPQAVESLETALDAEGEERVALEMGSSLARMNSAKGFDFLIEKIANPGEAFIPMETVFILTEIGDGNSADVLESIATSNDYHGNELRQAAVWGLGKAGAKAYGRLIQFIDDFEDDVAIHATTAFASDIPANVVDELVALLINGNQRQKAAVCEVLKMINTEYLINQLIQAAEANSDHKTWIIAALGKQSPDAVRAALQNNVLLDQIQPFFHMSIQENWLASDSKYTDLRFLLAQNIF